MAKSTYQQVYKPNVVDHPTLVVSKTEMMLATPYNREFIDRMKEKILFNERTWDKKKRVWIYPTSKRLMAILADLVVEIYKKKLDISLDNVSVDDILEDRTLDRSTHYSTLGVSEKATQAEIKKAFRQKARLFHSDKGGEDDHFMLVNEAYNVLKNPKRKKRYDAALRIVSGRG